jgi:predicted Zn-dependent peptidase
MNYNKKIIKLKNGIRILVVPIKTKLTNISISILLGELHEKPNELELTHYLEHIMGTFTSTKYKNSDEIKKELNKRGARTNAFVSNYETKFFIEGLYEDIEYYIDLLSNMLNNFYIDDNIVDVEKNAVIQELNNHMANNNYIFYMKIWRFMYYKYSYQFNYKKHINFIKKYNTNKLYDYFRNHILLNNVIISVTCPLNSRNRTIKLVKNAFNFNKINKKYKIKYPLYNYITKDVKIIHIKNTQHIDNTDIKIVVELNASRYSVKHLCLIYLNNILFNFETGIFYKILRRKLGLIYNISLEINIDDINDKSSSYSINSNIISKKLPELLLNIIRIIENLKITDDMINDARKKIIIDGEYNKFYDLNTQSLHYGTFLLYNKNILEVNDIIKLFSNIKNKQIYEELEKFKNDILHKCLIFYYSNKNMNNNIKHIINKNNILYKIKYISLK